MLKEKTNFEERLPVKINVVHIEEYPIHFHDDIELVFILDGSVILKNGYYNYIMKSGDIFILNDREIHSFKKTDEDNLVMMLQFDMDYFIKHYPNLNNSFFVTDMNETDEAELEVLRELLTSAIMQANSADLGYEQNIIEIAHNIITCLIEDFQYFAIEDGRFVNEVKKKSNKVLAARMNRISDYLYENYSRKLTLREIAEKEHLSIYHLSHVIKQATGLSFKELLGFIRVEESEKLLLGSDMSISSISEAVGFSATRYYIEHFKKWFDYDPKTYRVEYKGKVSSRKTLAIMKKSNKLEVRDIIKERYPSVYYDYHKEYTTPAQVLDIILDENTSENIYDTELHKMLSTQDMSHADRLLSMLVGLSEPVIASGENYIITSDKDANYLSVLVYYFPTRDDKNADILVRIQGLQGKYNLKRVSLTYENITALKDPQGADSHHYRREGLFKKLASTPTVDYSIVTAVNSLNFQLSFSGLSGTLLLLDKLQK